MQNPIAAIYTPSTNQAILGFHQIAFSPNTTFFHANRTLELEDFYKFKK